MSDVATEGTIGSLWRQKPKKKKIKTKASLLVRVASACSEIGKETNGLVELLKKDLK